MKNSITLLAAIITLNSFISCKQEVKEVKKTTETIKEVVKKETVYDTNNPKSMLMAASESLGGFDKLKKLNDVSFTYNYVSPDGKKDVSVEKYIFQDEVF